MRLTDITARYSPAESWFYDRVAANAVLDAVADSAHHLLTTVPDGGSVLEVGCGGGQLAQWLIASRPDISVLGIDLSAEQINRATARSKTLMPANAARVHFLVASALELPLADTSFDAVVSIASIKHWPGRRKGITEMIRVLKAGGRLLAAETDRGCHLADARRFVDNTRLPAPLKVPFLLAFRTYVAGQGLDLDDVRELINDQALVDTAVQRIPDTPFLALWGTKRSAAYRERQALGG